MATKVYDDDEQVTLVALEAFAPYKKGDVFTVNGDVANMILTADPRRENDFGAVYTAVKVREYKEGEDEHLLVANGVYTQKEQREFAAKQNASKDKK